MLMLLSLAGYNGHAASGACWRCGGACFKPCPLHPLVEKMHDTVMNHLPGSEGLQWP